MGCRCSSKADEEEDYSGVKEFNLVWLDPLVNSGENAEYQKKFKAIFKNVTFLERYENMDKIFDESQDPIVFISCGDLYENVKSSVEKRNHVLAIVINSTKLELFEKYQRECSKVLAVVNSFSNLDKHLRKVTLDYSRFLRFYGNRTQKTFYGLEDKEAILKGLSHNTGLDVFSIFYPLRTNDICLEEILTGENIDLIENKVKGDLQLNECKKKHIYKVLKSLKAGVTNDSIIKSYTQEGLYQMLNSYLRVGIKDGLELFRRYMFCLKAGMCEICRPVINENTLVYRGLGLNEEIYGRYKQSCGQITLLAEFMSTSLEKKMAMKYANSSAVGTTLFEIQFTNFDEFYANFIKKFDFPRENGVFFPVDISEHSQYSDEKEVLFPPFYPIKIIEVKDEEKPRRIIAQAPFYVNVVGKSDSSPLLKNEEGKNDYKNRVYIDTQVKLLKLKAIDKISIVNQNIVKNKGFFTDLFGEIGKAIKEHQKIQEITIEHEKLEVEDFERLISADIFKMESLQVLSLGHCNITDEIAKRIGPQLKDNKSLKNLNLKNNEIGNEGAIAIGLSLKDHITLSALDLGGNCITDKVETFILFILSNNNKLTSLKIIHHFDNLEKRKEIGLEFLNTTSLDIRKNKIGDEGAKAIVLVLEQNQRLTTLDLRRNNINAEGAKAIGYVLGQNKTLTKLDLRYNSIGVEGAKAIGLALEKNETLTALSLYENNICAEGAIAIGSALEQNKTLTTLRFNCNNIADQGARAMGLALEKKIIR